MGAIVGAVHQAAQKAQPAVTEIRDRIRPSPVVHAGETGWRENGSNGCVWTFSAPIERYFLRRGRNKELVDEALGDSFDGVLVSGFYAACHHYSGLKQRRWVHPCASETFGHPQARQRRRVQRRLERKLPDLCRPCLKDPAAVQGKLCRRMEKHIKELFVFVAVSGVPAENNAAERSLRPLVVSRKISGVTRSESGATSKMTLASLFGIWAARGLDLPIPLPPVAPFPSTLNCYILNGSVPF